MRDRSCAMVVVGNEILSGKVRDTNAYFAARELRRVGVMLKRIGVVPDETTRLKFELPNGLKLSGSAPQCKELPYAPLVDPNQTADLFHM